MVGHGAKFGRKKEEAIAALLSQRNIEEAARAVGIGTATLARWMQLPDFKMAYREARRDAFSQSIGRLQQASSAAVSTLLKVMVDSNSPASSRVRAADCVLGHAAKAIEIEDLDILIAAGEAQKEGLPLTGGQMAAQRAFARAVAQSRFGDSPGLNQFQDRRP